jgi:hypothetical protein
MSAEAQAVDDGPGPGTVVGGRYRLVRLVGEGGMGRVFLADDERDGGHVAVKLLADDRAIPKAAQRFEREARAIARIDHPHVVRVTEVGQSPRGGLYYVMEYLEGEELGDTLEREGPMPWPRARHIALQICSALQAAHEAAVVHRDLKLENCFRVVEGEDHDFIKILDFGVVKLLAPDRGDGSGRLTNTGATMGTPAYMAPELCRGKQVDHRVDVYALGVMLYELLTGSVPFEGDSFLDVALKHMNDPPPPLSEHLPPADLPIGLEAVVMRALAKAREDRFPTMAAFGRALERVGEADALASPSAPIEPSRPVVVDGGPVPALSAAVSLVGGTEPALVGVEDAPAVPTRARRAAWPWLALGGAVAVGVVGWWLVIAPRESRDAVEPAWVVDAEGKEPAPVKTSTPELPAEPHDRLAADTAAITEASAGAEPSMSGGSGESGGSGGSGGSSAASPGLTDRQINGTLRHIQPLVKGCAGSLTGGHPGDRVRVTLRVDRVTGRLRSVEVSDEHRRSSVEGCIREALRKAEFPRVGGRGTQTVKRTLVL